MNKVNGINNYKEYARNYGFVVVRLVDSEMWFYGAYETLDKASDVAQMIDGLVVFQ